MPSRSPARIGFGGIVVASAESPTPPFRAEKGPSEWGPVLEAANVWFAYPGELSVLRGVSLTLAPGGITALLGASGSGKTTLLKLVKGLLVPQRGRLVVLGRTLAAGGQARVDARVAYIPQQLGLVRGLSVLDNTLMGALGRTSLAAGLCKIFPRAEVRRAQETLAAVGLAHKTHERVRALSGGERQRVAIARALMQEPRLLVADEFVSQLDPVTTAEIMDIVAGIARAGVTVLMTTHELDVVARYADRVVVLRHGETALNCLARDVAMEDLPALLRR